MIENKFNIDDEVFFYDSRIIKKGKIISIEVTKINYYNIVNINTNEFMCFLEESDVFFDFESLKIKMINDLESKFKLDKEKINNMKE